MIAFASSLYAGKCGTGLEPDPRQPDQSKLVSARPSNRRYRSEDEIGRAAATAPLDSIAADADTERACDPPSRLGNNRDIGAERWRDIARGA